MKTLLRYLFLVLILAGTVSSCDWYSVILWNWCIRERI